MLREIKLAEKEKKNEVIDGQQRIRVAQEFYEDKLTLPQSLADLGACAVEICDNRDGMFMEV